MSTGEIYLYLYINSWVFYNINLLMKRIQKQFEELLYLQI